MSGKFELKCKSELHNYFEIEVYDGAKLKQTAYAQNVIIDEYFKISYEQMWYIGIGRGIGEPSPSDQTLFSEIGRYGTRADYYVISEEEHIYGLKFECEILPEEAVGESITEIGLMAGYHSLKLYTHAMIKDAEGNPIAIHKTATDKIKVKAHMIARINYPNEHCYSIKKGVGEICKKIMPTHNEHANMSSGIMAVGVDSNTFTQWTGSSYYYGNHQNSYENNQGWQKLIVKRRYKTEEVNIAIHSFIVGNEILIPVTSLPDWRGYDINDEILGMGDELKKEFTINWVQPESIKVFKNNELISNDNYSIVVIDNYVLYGLRFIEVIKTNYINNKNDNRLDVRYKDLEKNIFIAKLVNAGTIVLFEITNDDVILHSSLYYGQSEFKSYGNLKTLKTLYDNKYYNIIDNKFVSCSEDEVLSTVEDERLDDSFKFDNGIIKMENASPGMLQITNFYIYKNVIKKKIVFNTPPLTGEEIKVDYHVNYIPKDEKHVLDVNFTAEKRPGQSE